MPISFSERSAARRPSDRGTLIPSPAFDFHSLKAHGPKFHGPESPTSEVGPSKPEETCAKRKIFLIGFMGAGKSTVGRCLARRLGYSFVDLDERIEMDAGRSIPEIFNTSGEASFRSLESEALESLEGEGPAVVATGGGAPTADINAQWMRRQGQVVWLNVPFEILADRVAADESRPLAPRRPLFADVDQAHQLFEARRSLYDRAAHLVVEPTSDQTPEHIAQIIDCQLTELPGAQRPL